MDLPDEGSAREMSVTVGCVRMLSVKGTSCILKGLSVSVFYQCTDLSESQWGGKIEVECELCSCRPQCVQWATTKKEQTCKRHGVTGGLLIQTMYFSVTSNGV